MLTPQGVGNGGEKGNVPREGYTEASTLFILLLKVDCGYTRLLFLFFTLDNFNVSETVIHYKMFKGLLINFSILDSPMTKYPAYW